MTTGQDQSNGHGTAGLKSRSFLALLVTQGFGSLNDNIFRWFCVLQGMKIASMKASTMSLGLVCFTIPYLLLASHSAYVSDRFSKQKTIVACKVAEILIMALAVGAMALGGVDEMLGIYVLFAAVFLMGSQSAMFGPAKFGSIPEIVRSEKISEANGLMQMVTTAAAALGMFAGFVVSEMADLSTNDPTLASLMWPAVVLITIAALGTIASAFIEPLTPADTTRQPPNPLRETVGNLKLLFDNRPLFRAALGEAFFWFLASMATSAITLMGNEVLGLSQIKTGMLAIALVLGVGTGSVLAGLMSGGKVELGLVPLGGTVVALGALALYWFTADVDPTNPATQLAAVWPAAASLVVLGLGAGFFIVPLVAFQQDRSQRKTRGRILAAANFISFSMMIVSAVVFYVVTEGGFGWSAPTIFLATGIGTIPILVYVLWLLPQASIRMVIWLLSRVVYRVRVFGRDNIPRQGGALLVANHVSYMDGFLLLTSSSRPIRFVAHADHINRFGIAKLTRVMGVIPIRSTDGPKAIVQSLRQARAAVEAGELVCIFPEGQLTHSGHVEQFHRGMMKIVDGLDAPIVPIYLDELWGSIFSHEGGRSLWKMPKRWPYPVSIHIGQPCNCPESVEDVRAAVLALAPNPRTHLPGTPPMAPDQPQLVPPRQLIRTCKSAGNRQKVADSSGKSLSGTRLLAGTVALKRVLNRGVLSADEKMVGVLIPPSVGGTVVNAALSIDHRVAVNLNYTLSAEVMNFCIKDCGIKTVLTSRAFMEKRPFEPDDAKLVYVEDLMQQLTGLDKLVGGLQAKLLPAGMVDAIHGLGRIQPDDLLTIIFTSGSTGDPKGVMLSNNNVGSNIEAVHEMFQITADDVMLGVLPFFHSFGYTGTLWLTLSLESSCVFHFNPLDSRTVGALSEEHGVTIILTTPTFLRSYMKRCTPEQMHRLELVIVGAEKMPTDVAEQFNEKFGVEPTEGYGTTELSPVASMNVPDHRAAAGMPPGTRLGTVGKVCPGSEIKVVDPDSRADLGTDTEGLFLFRGPNVMLGYLNNDKATSEKIQDGWYDTGDMGILDEEGFITITGRMSRFSKIGGEMVPHIKIEQELERMIEGDDEDPVIQVAVAAVPDDRKGERLIVLHRPLPAAVTIDSLIQGLSDQGLPNIWIPSSDSFLEVQEIPLLGTGKMDLKAVGQTALDHFASS